MERPLEVVAYLLAKMVSKAENKPVETILAEAIEATRKRDSAQKQEEKKDNMAVVEEIYKLYPGKCPVSGRSTGKCSKDKNKIATLLKERDAEDVKSTIRWYLEDCVESKTYIKNFGTLLNQFPEKKTEPPKPKTEPRAIQQDIWDDPLYKEWRKNQHNQ